MHQLPFNVNFCAAILGVLAFIASPAKAESGSASEGNPICVHYRAEAVLGVAGYNHFVYVGSCHMPHFRHRTFDLNDEFVPVESGLESGG